MKSGFLESWNGDAGVLLELGLVGYLIPTLLIVVPFGLNFVRVAVVWVPLVLEELETTILPRIRAGQM